MMNIACADETVVLEVRAVLKKYVEAQVRQQGPNLGSPMIWVMVAAAMGEDKERSMRRDIAQIPGATIRS
jgi:hypothetical protein